MGPSLILLRRMLSVVYLMTHPAVPYKLRALPVIALVYFLWPRDLFFDYRPFGFVDDLVIGFILLAVFTARAWPYALKADHRKEEMRKEAVKVEFKVVEEEEEEAQSRKG